MSINVTVWNEFRHEKMHDEVAEVYSDGIRVAFRDDPEARNFLDLDGRRKRT
jgi:trehalose utilization protein